MKTPRANGALLRKVARSAGFSLIEVLAVAAIIGILAALLVPSVIRETDQATLNQEISNLNAFSNALVLNILQTQTIPAYDGIASAIASNLPMPLSTVTNNSRNFTRSFLVDPSLNLPINGTASSLPYSQTTNAIVNELGQPFSARMMIVSTLATANPPVTTGIPSPSSFNDMWNTPVNNNPATWTTWNGNGRDVVIQRINLQPLFYHLILINHDATNAATFSINTTNTTPVSTNGTGWDSYYLSGSIVGLCDSNGVAMTRYTLTRSISFVFENGMWSGQILNGASSNPVNLPAVFATAATNFFGSILVAGAGADQASVLSAMANFMMDYTLWADDTTGPPLYTPAPFYFMTTNPPMHQLLTGAAANLGTYSSEIDQ